MSVAKCRCGQDPKGVRAPVSRFLKWPHWYIIQCRACGIGFQALTPSRVEARWNEFQAKLYRSFTLEKFKSMRKKIGRSLKGKK